MTESSELSTAAVLDYAEPSALLEGGRSERDVQLIFKRPRLRLDRTMLVGLGFLLFGGGLHESVMGVLDGEAWHLLGVAIRLYLLLAMLDELALIWLMIRGRPLQLWVSATEVGWRIGGLGRSWPRETMVRLVAGDAGLVSDRVCDLRYVFRDKMPRAIWTGTWLPGPLRLFYQPWWWTRRELPLPVMVQKEAAREAMRTLKGEPEGESSAPE